MKLFIDLKSILRTPALPLVGRKPDAYTALPWEITFPDRFPNDIYRTGRFSDAEVLRNPLPLFLDMEAEGYHNAYDVLNRYFGEKYPMVYLPTEADELAREVFDNFHKRIADISIDSKFYLSSLHVLRTVQRKLHALWSR